MVSANAVGMAAGVTTGAGLLVGLDAADGLSPTDLLTDLVIVPADILLTSTFETALTGSLVKTQATADGVLAATKIAGRAATIISLVYVAVQILLDTLWNPFDTKFNPDLEKERQQVQKAWKDELSKYGLGYPLEAKPDVVNEMDEQKFVGYIKEYYALNNIITPAELEQRGYAAREAALTRRIQFINAVGDTISSYANVLEKQKDVLDLEEKSIAILLTAAVLSKKRQTQLASRNALIPPFYEQHTTLVQVLGVSCPVIICILCSLIATTSST